MGPGVRVLFLYIVCFTLCDRDSCRERINQLHIVTTTTIIIIIIIVVVVVVPPPRFSFSQALSNFEIIIAPIRDPIC